MKMDVTISLPMPLMAKICSMITVPPMRLPMVMAATVSSEKLEGRNAWRNRMRRLVMPLAFATPM